MLQFGLELEGGFLKSKNFINTNNQLKEKDNYKGEIYLKEDCSATGVPSKYGHEYNSQQEFISKEPIIEEEISNHIQDFKVLFEELDFKYYPINCGLHIHFSPVEGWNIDHLKKFLPNLISGLSPFIKFFSQRKKQDYCYHTYSHTNLLRFLLEDLPRFNTVEDFKKEYKKLNGLSNGISDSITEGENYNRNKLRSIQFGKKHIITLFTRHNSFELRFFPPEIELVESFINLIKYFWYLEEDISKKKLMNNNMFDTLKLIGREEDIKYYRDYYNYWIREE